ncbi:hypothetical protein IEQ34_012007 [Dendrobium chrysotoxum]|uniref:Uncharacterized protein n=1 Tax=Dendrobium chrysotoxum TaxID=161865 RepID=A0AAV7GU21_DENCH|nr:hypothetical protein IEQ34_012007 [Dendrobium chrysotoxum]
MPIESASHKYRRSVYTVSQFTLEIENGEAGIREAAQESSLEEHGEMLDGKLLASSVGVVDGTGLLCRWRGVLVESGARWVAHEAGRVHKDLAPALVRLETGEAFLVQIFLRNSLFSSPRHHPGLLVPHREGRR